MIVTRLYLKLFKILNIILHNIYYFPLSNFFLSKGEDRILAKAKQKLKILGEGLIFLFILCSFSFFLFAKQKERKTTKKKEKTRFFIVGNDDINRHCASFFKLGINFSCAIFDSAHRRLIPPKLTSLSVFSFFFRTFFFLLLTKKEKRKYIIRINL